MFVPSDADLFRDPRWHISELVYDFEHCWWERVNAGRARWPPPTPECPPSSIKMFLTRT